MGKVVSDYVSDHTLWMQKMMAEHPEWAADQVAGRALWWDKPQDPELAAGFARARVAQKPYPYDVNFFPDAD